MLIEQIIEFELRGPVVAHVLLQPVISLTKQKVLRQIFEWIIIYC